MPTLSTTLILQDIMQAFKVRVPMLRAFSTNFTSELLKLNSQAIAHIRTLPTSATYDASTGYANGATEGRSLLVDVPVTIDSHKHVPIELSHLYAIQDQKESYLGAVGDAGYVLGKEVVDSVLAKFTGANVSYEKVEAAVNCDFDTLGSITSGMNQRGASPMGRIGIVSSDVMEGFFTDAKIASRDYYGQLPDGTALRVLRNLQGFSAIYEYPDMPDNNAASGAFTAATTDICTKVGHGLETGDKVRLTTTDTLPAGLAVSTTYYVIKLTADTFKLASSDANATAGTAVDVTDTGTGTHSIAGYENVIGIFFEPRAVALKAGVPKETNQIAASLGIPQHMAWEPMTDPDSGFTLLCVKWQQSGTGDLFMSPASIWGSSVGRQAGAAGSITDKAATILRSA